MNAEWDAALSWLHEQLDEDERVACAATTGPWRWMDPARPKVKLALVGSDNQLVLPVAGEPYPLTHDATHIVRHDPAAILRRVESDRLIPAMHAAAHDESSHDAESEARFFLMCDVVKALAARYVGVPGFPEVLRLDQTETR